MTETPPGPSAPEPHDAAPGPAPDSLTSPVGAFANLRAPAGSGDGPPRPGGPHLGSGGRLPGISLRRKLVDRLVLILVCLAFALALIPLISVLWLVVSRGLKRLDMTFFTHSTVGIGPRDATGGAYHAIIGTIEQVLLAAVIAVPLGILTAIYLVEYGPAARRKWLARSISFFVDVMTGVPSIVAGLFVLAFWVIGLNMGFSGFAVALALAVIMLPIVVRSTEEMLRLVPNDLREASLALGVPKWRTTLFVVLPTSFTGILTGIMLAVARVAGEAAPALLLAFYTDYINFNAFHGPQLGLALFTFDQASQAQQTYIDRAWTGALALILLVMVLNLGARLIAWRRAPARER